MLQLVALLLAAGLVLGSGESQGPPLQTQEGEHPGGAIKLTRPDGTPIFVNPLAVAFIRGPLPGEHGHTTVVFSSGAKQTVLESVEDIGKIMDAEREDAGP